MSKHKHGTRPAVKKELFENAIYRPKVIQQKKTAEEKHPKRHIVQELSEDTVDRGEETQLHHISLAGSLS